MRTLKVFFLLLILATQSFAQAPVVEGTYLPVRGTRILQVYDTTAVNLFIPSTGPDQYWDYSNGFINLTDSFSLATMHPDSSGYGDLFPEATHAAFLTLPWNSIGDSLYIFFIIDTAGIHNIGAQSIKAGIDAAYYSDPYEYVMPFDVTYGTIIEDTTRSEAFLNYAGYDLKAVQYIFKKMEGVGYGTLNGPLGEMADVLLGKETILKVDSFFVDLLGTGDYQYNPLVAPYGTNPSYANMDKWHFLRNNTFASTHLMLIQSVDTGSTEVSYGWYTLPIDFGSISGLVYDSIGNPVTSGEMLLYREHSNFTKNDILDRAIIQNNGFYQFDSIPYGEYRIAARPDLSLYPNALTTYYGDTTNWLTCPTLITNGDTSEVNINILYFPIETGSATIEGTIELDLKFSGRSLRAGDPIPGIDIALEQIPGGIINNQDITEEDGSFTMTGVEDGNYKLFVDIPGLEMAETYNIEVKEGDIIKELNFTIGTDSIFPTNTPQIIPTSINELPFATLNIFPNPFGDQIQIQVNDFELDQLFIQILDVYGKVVYRNNYSSFSEGISIETSPFAKGMYLLNLETNKREIGNYRIVKQ